MRIIWELSLVISSFLPHVRSPNQMLADFPPQRLGLTAQFHRSTITSGEYMQVLAHKLRVHKLLSQGRQVEILHVILGDNYCVEAACNEVAQPRSTVASRRATLSAPGPPMMPVDS